MMDWRAALVAAAVLAGCSQPQSGAPEAAPEAAVAAPSVAVSEAWAAATPNAAQVAAGYATLTNNGAAEDRLVSASSPRAARVEIHEMAMEGGMMNMRAVPDGVALAPGAPVSLAPGGLHIMFMDITAPFVDGETVPVTLTFTNAPPVTLDFPVRPRTAGAH